MKKLFAAVFLLLLVPLIVFLPTGCSSAFVAATITNNSGFPVTLIEVDYPSASFGVGSLAAGSQFHYRFKVQGSGPVKMQFTDASGKAHAVSGPDLAEGDRGTLGIAIGQANAVSWLPVLAKNK
jgi:hypothetical protein